MGELAVRELLRLAEAGQVDAVDDLWEIGTPQVSLALASLLWAADQDAAIRAAWRLGGILAFDNVKLTLRGMSLTEDQKRADWFDWVWEPFGEPETSALPVIVGRISHLIFEDSRESEVVNRLESRLGLALCVASMESDIELEWISNPESAQATKLRAALGINQETKRLPEERSTGSLLTPYLYEEHSTFGLDEDKDRDMLSDAISCFEASRHFQRLLTTPEKRRALKLITRTAVGPVPTIDDWRNVFKPSDFSFRRSWLFFIVLISVVALAAISFFGMYKSNVDPPIKRISVVIVVFNILTMATLVGTQGEERDSLKEEARLFLSWPFGAFEFLLRVSREAQIPAALLFPLGIAIPHLLFCGWFPIVAYFTFELFLPVAPWYTIVISWLVFAVISTGLWSYGSFLQRRALNVLHGIVEPLPSSHEKRLARTRSPTAILLPLLKRLYRMPVWLDSRRRSS